MIASWLPFAVALCLHLKTIPSTAAAAASTPGVSTIIDRFVANLNERVHRFLAQTGNTLDATFTANARDLCDLCHRKSLFNNGTYADTYNTTQSGLVRILDTIHQANKHLTHTNNADFRATIQQLRQLPNSDSLAASATQMAHVYRQYERGYRWVHSEYRLDVQCNYALMYDRGVVLDNLADTDDTAHVTYANIVHKVRRMNVANRRDIEAQTSILVGNVSDSLRRLGAEMLTK